MKELYLDDPDSREWLLSTHAKSALSDEEKALVRRCTSAFILYGNEDSPEAVQIFQTSSPMYGEWPMFQLLRDSEGNLQKHDKPLPKRIFA